MSTSKGIFITSLVLFSLIAGAGWWKNNRLKAQDEPVAVESNIDLLIEDLEDDIESKKYLHPVQDLVADQEVDNVWRLFTKTKDRLPIVDTVRYKSRVSWLEGRPAWVTDYATHFSTSRHFIARSLNGNHDYYNQKVSTGDYFNVLIKDLEFYVVVDLSRCKLWLYAHDINADERYLLKTYRVGLGRFSDEGSSGLLTPMGNFTLGDKIAIYNRGMEGYFQDSKVEMVTVFGSRWLPFMEKGEDGELYSIGYGFHGAPWALNKDESEYFEDVSTIGDYASDGCIRLSQKDIEELYAIVITKPTFVHIVTDFHDVELPGKLDIEE